MKDMGASPATDPQFWREVEEVFSAVLEAGEAGRTATLDAHCGGRSALRAEVEALLAAHAGAGDFINPEATGLLLGGISSGGEDAELEDRQPTLPEPTQLAQGTRLGPYEIAAVLGRGGMGVVYRAHDARLGRDVAIKVLPRDLAANPDHRRRFDLEARAASALSHPNIVAVYDAGWHETVPFLVSELLEGEPLTERLARGPLPVREALDYAAQTARGLIAAHQRGIVHRDLKPGNLFLTSQGLLKILDFGVAKLTGPREERIRVADDRAPATTTGLIPGTAAYMSPEQVRGDTVDARSDQFALGCVLYEMLTGIRPFKRDTPVQSMAAVLEDEPAPVTEKDARVPEAVARLVQRCLAKDPQARYPATGDLAQDLERMLGRTEESPPSSPTRGRSRYLPLALVGAAVLAGLAYVVSWRGPVTKDGRVLLAVLPFENLGGNADDEYLADGVTEEIITGLARLSPERLGVIARTSVMPYKTRPKTVEDIASELRVDYVLMGSVRHAGGRLRISAQLIDAGNETHLWADTYDRDLSDVLQAEAEVAEAIARRLSIRLLPRTTSPAAPPSAEAHTAYLKGLHFWNKRNEEGVRRAIELFGEAIVREPSYARAHAGLATAHASLATSADAVAAREARNLAEIEARRALELDPQLAEGHAALAVVRCRFDWNWAECERELTQAIALDPSYATGHQWLGELYLQRGRFEQGLLEMTKARELDPVSPAIHSHEGLAHMYSRRYADALAAYEQAIEIDPRFLLAHRMKGMTLILDGRSEQGIVALRHARGLDPDGPRAAADLGHALATAGQTADARSILGELQQMARRRSVSGYDFALIHAGLGEKEKAVEWLEKTYEERSPGVRWLKVEPRFEALRTEPRFQALLSKIGLPG